MRVPNLKKPEFHAADECPVCRSRDVERGETFVNVTLATQPAVCGHCDSSWVTTFEVTGYCLLRTGDEVKIAA